MDVLIEDKLYLGLKQFIQDHSVETFGCVVLDEPPKQAAEKPYPYLIFEVISNVSSHTFGGVLADRNANITLKTLTYTRGTKDITAKRMAKQIDYYANLYLTAVGASQLTYQGVGENDGEDYVLIETYRLNYYENKQIIF